MVIIDESRSPADKNDAKSEQNPRKNIHPVKSIVISPADHNKSQHTTSAGWPAQLEAQQGVRFAEKTKTNGQSTDIYSRPRM